MDNATIKVQVDIHNGGSDTPSASQTNIWTGLSGEQVLFIEKHLLGALAGIQKEAAELMTKMSQANSERGDQKDQGPR